MLTQTFRDLRQQWKEEGREEGREEKQFEIARTMLSRNLSLSLIAEVTGLSEGEILNLRKNMEN